MLEDERNRLDGANQRPRRQGVHDVVRYDLDVREPLVRGLLHQLELAHADLALRIAAPPPDRPDRRLHEHLRIPVVRFEEQQLPARLQQAVERGKVLGVGVVAEDRGADDVVEALRGEIAEIVETWTTRVFGSCRAAACSAKLG